MGNNHSSDRIDAETTFCPRQDCKRVGNACIISSIQVHCLHLGHIAAIESGHSVFLNPHCVVILEVRVAVILVKDIYCNVCCIQSCVRLYNSLENDLGIGKEGFSINITCHSHSSFRTNCKSPLGFTQELIYNGNCTVVHSHNKSASWAILYQFSPLVFAYKYGRKSFDYYNRKSGMGSMLAIKYLNCQIVRTLLFVIQLLCKEHCSVGVHYECVLVCSHDGEGEQSGRIVVQGVVCRTKYITPHVCVFRQQEYRGTVVELGRSNYGDLDECYGILI